MRSLVPRQRRCAVYTRKSSEEGLEQDFNSLHAQRDACEAYINSQRHDGWTALSTVYDDGGYSGGSMDRPALKQLLADVETGSVDIVVVYKVDRLTRSLADFAKIVDVFDAASVSFVSVTQQFNTTSSMGRLTLNVLLSFAQFERELTGERIRDKITASKKKGMWMGGWVPLGYDRMDRTLKVNDLEAQTVRTIFDLFLKFKNVRNVQNELARLDLRTKPYSIQRGRAIGNLPFARGHIYKILSNPLYLGEIVHKGACHPGQHPALISPTTWDAVQAQLSANGHKRRSRSNAKSPNLLIGLMYDDAGNRLASSHTSKNGKRYRYYATPNRRGRSLSSEEPDQLRVPAAQADDIVLGRLYDFLTESAQISSFLGSGYRVAEIRAAIGTAKQLAQVIASEHSERKMAIVSDLVSRVIVGKTSLKINLSSSQLCIALSNNASEPPSPHGEERDISLEVPFVGTARAGSTKFLIDDYRRPQADSVLVKAIARARSWFEQLRTGKAQSMAQIAARENITDNYVSNLIHLAWLPPKQVQQILDGDPAATVLGRNKMRTRTVDPLWADS
ncbi:recombinase family protein [Bradyrhizobium barranii subsp. apii]|uniref:recombinase family protein n=1 Tax=Bradyrhizobium barranii TaxID=2992140 RepID=UPI001AA0F865|nr:recombinase family protein [Bradyrhizobium barranii]UPT96048.1 recombinase family protein [Bradyrhizobium barranii subsp. apii]